MQWYLKVLKDYAVFSGRARRKEYWMFTLVNMIISIIISVVEAIIGLEYPVLGTIYMLALLLPVIGLTIRRLHDTDRSGYWLLLWLIPIIGWIALFVFTCLEGTSGSNRFGADPKAGEIN